LAEVALYRPRRPNPQLASELVWHTPMRQQPEAQLTAPHPLHARATQVCGVGQLWQAAPAEPQAPG